MRMYDLILKKKQGGELSTDEIRYMIEGFTEGSIPDYQMSAMTMAICFRGMTPRETVDLTLAMRDSGDVLDLSGIKGVKVDKHSTGGVGDKTSLALTPIIAALGVPVAKMSGRGLGHTGGTIDKLECFDGFTTALSEEQFAGNVNTIGIAIAGQTANLAPADKKLYALRDVTATVDQMSLIASSIMSKKLASGSDAIVLDVKTGSGAIMQDLEGSIALGKAMVEIGALAGRPVTALRIGQGPRCALYNASHHANEWITTPVLLQFLEQYAYAVATEGRILGMDAQQLWETTLNPETRILKRVEIEDARMASDVTEMLMGSDVPPRKAFIYEHAQDAELDI